MPGGVADIFNGGSAGGASVGDAEERTRENPRNADAWRDLASALQQDGKQEEAIAPMERYVALKPKDASALGTLASLYMIKAQNLSSQVQNAQVQAALANPGQDFALPADSPFGKALATNPVTDAIAGQSNGRLQTLYTQATQAFEQAKLKYAALAQLQPNDASIQIQLAQAAENANDSACDRGVRAVPQARAGRSERGRREAAAPGAPGVLDHRRWLDSRRAESQSPVSDDFRGTR